MKRNFKPFLILLILIISILTLCGCNQKITDQEKLVNKIESIVPGAQFKDMKEEPGEEEGEVIRTYKFKANGIEFSVNNTLLREDYFSNLANGYRHNYLKRLTYEKKSDIEKIAKKYNIAICFNGFDNKEESATFKQENSVACYFNGDEGDWGDSIALTFYVDDNKTFDNIDDFLYDLKKELEDYIPLKSEKMFKSFISLSINTKEKIRDKTYEPDIINNTSMNFVEEEMEQYDTFINWSDYLYKNYVYNNQIDDPDVNLDNFQPHRLNKLYINDELFEPKRDDYKTEFVYNIDDEQYYAIVCFGCKFDYNGGVEDYVQREIIQKYYPDSRYEIDSKFNKTSYKIGRDRFVIDRNDFATDGDLVFTRNKQTLNIKELSAINTTTPGPSYFKFIPLEDFAMLCGLKVDGIDIEGEAVYCSTNQKE